MSDDIDYDSVPGIAMTQWRAGRVLTQADVDMIARLLKQHDDEIGSEQAAFDSGREQLLRELGGQEFVDLDQKGMELDGKLAWKRACAKVAEKQAALDKLTQ